MFEIYKNEIRLYGKWALGLTALHAAFWAIPLLLGNTGAYRRLLSLAANTSLLVSVTVCGAACAGAFGLLQGYRFIRGGHWLFLMHRPLRPTAIGISCLAAGISFIVLSIVLPVSIVIGTAKAAWPDVIDFGYFNFALYMFLASTLCHLGGVFAALHPNKATMLIPPLLFFGVSAFPSIFHVVCVLPVLCYLALAAFRYDVRSKRQPLPIIAIAATFLQVAAYLALIPLFDVGRIVPSAHDAEPPVIDSIRLAYPHLGGNSEYLVASQTTVSDLLRRIPANEPIDVEIAAQISPADRPIWNMSYYAGRRNPLQSKWNWGNEYSRSHDNEALVYSGARRLFTVVDTRSRATVAYLGKRGLIEDPTIATEHDRFTSADVYIQQAGSRDSNGDSRLVIYLSDSDALYRVDPYRWAVTPFLTFADGDGFATNNNSKFILPTVQSSSHDYLVSQRYVYDFGPSSETSFEAPAHPIGRIEHPIELDSNVDVMVVPYGDEFAAVYLDRGGKTPTLFARYSGASDATVISTEVAVGGEPAVGFAASPVLHSLLGPRFISGQTDAVRLWRSSVAVTSMGFVLGLLVLSGVAAIFVCRRLRIGGPHSIYWILASFIVGLPALISLLLMADWKARHRATSALNVSMQHARA